VHAEELFCAHGEVCSLRVAQTTTSSGAWQMHVSRCMVCQGEGLTAHVRGKRCKSMLNSHTKGLVCCEGVKWARSQPCVELHTFPWYKRRLGRIIALLEISLDVQGATSKRLS